jgi:hypothetical protein
MWTSTEVCGLVLVGVTIGAATGWLLHQSGDEERNHRMLVGYASWLIKNPEGRKMLEDMRTLASVLDGGGEK